MPELKYFLCQEHSIIDMGRFDMGCELVAIGIDEEDAEKAWASQQFGEDSDCLDIVEDQYVYDDGEKQVTLEFKTVLTDPLEIQVLCKYLPVCKHQE